MKSKNPVILVIRDGWGYRRSSRYNAIAQTATPNTDKLMKECPHTLLKASGEAVGLPKGYQGNSEVGHMTIGSGRIIFQPMERINHAMKTREFFRISEFLDAIANCKKNNSKLHIIGLLQTEGVHSHINHLFALLELCKMQDFNNIYVHVITDGRDSYIKDGIKYVKELIKKLKRLGIGRIATLSGRYYAMDRDKRWDRTKKAYDCIVNAQAEEFDNIIRQLKVCYKNNETDEFIKPRKASFYNGMKPKDSVIFYNFRTDRPRQLTKAIVEKKFEGWNRRPLNVFYVAMTQYYKPMNAKVAFKDQIFKNLLGEVIAKYGFKQLRISETEKYAHVTFFFNGQIEKPNKNEDRILIPSPKVATYDLKPEMSAYKVTETLIRKIRTKVYDFIVVNLVNGDMVGHTGNVEAIKKAVSAVDDCVGKIVNVGLENNYTLLVFADHGNAENQSPRCSTCHTKSPVPFVLISNNKRLRNCKLKRGSGLQDIAPTVLDLLNIKKPKEMSGKSIIK